MKFKHGTRRRALEYEKDWVQRWKEDGTFEKSVTHRSADNAYVFYDGPPFITGVPHHGTLLSSIVKDAVPRYWTMKGKRVERVWGWDTHGLPAENFVEKQLNITDRRQIVKNADEPAPLDKDGNELPKITLEEYINKARESMVANAATWEDVVDRIGRWVNFKGAYKTMDKDFMESVWWAFKELYDKGKIYEGEKVLMYDTKFATPVSKNEVTMDNDAYQTVTDPSVFVKFRVKDDLETDFSDCDVVIVKAGVKKDDKVLWVQEKKEIAKHLWNMPGGKVEDGEDLETALRREIDEELGLGVKSLRRVKTHRLEDEHGKIAIVLYETELSDGEIKLENKLEGYGWFSIEEVEEMFANGEVRGEVEIAQTRDILEPIQEYLLAWTTTPWTLPGNTALAVNKDLEYVEVKVGNEQFVLAKALVEKVLQDEKHQPLEYEVVRTLKGSELVGKSYEPLFANHGENAHKVWAADYVSAENGTGIVHLAPIYGEEDFVLAQENNIPRVHVLDDNGYYFPEVAEQLFALMPWVDSTKPLEVWDNNKNIAKGLEKAGVVWKTEYIRHEYPFNPRSKQRIMYRAIPSWFFDAQGSKPLMLEQNENINWFPEHLKYGRFAKNIEQAPDWNLSRDRFWATAMPVWKGDKGTVKVVGSYAELKELSGVELEDYHRPWVDDITFDLPYTGDKDSTSQTEELDVLDDNGNLTGKTKDRKLIHRDGDWHKAVHIWIVNDNNEILLQRRVAWKDSNPNMLDISCAGHVVAGDSSLSSAVRELSEELGIDVTPEDLRFVKRFKHQSKLSPTFINNEFNDMFILSTKKTVAEMKIQEEEVAEAFFVSFEKFREMVEKKDPELLQHTEEFAVLLDYFDGKQIPHEELNSEKSGETEHFTRIDKVLDCWFESGSMPFAQFHYPFENKEKFEANFPGDFIVEYVGQVRAWFYYVHVVNSSLFGTEAFKNVITTGVVAGNDGRKMSKSLGNFTDPNELMDKFSADSLRFLLLSSPLLNGEDFSLQDKDVGDVARKLSMVWNMYDFFTMYAEVDGWEYDGELADPLERLTSPLDIWIVSRLHQLVAEVEMHMDAYNIPDAMSPILPFLDDASNWYVRRSRRRFWKSEDDNDKNDAYRTLHYVLVRLAYVLAPFTPFLAEELYHNLTGDTESIHLKDWLSAGRVDELVVAEMATAREYINEGLSLRAKAGLKVRQPLASVTVPQMGEHIDFEPILLEELNVKAVKQGEEIAIDETVTPQLKREGLMREVIRFVQAARKNAGLNVDDRINLRLLAEDAELTEAIAEHRDTIYTETLAVSDEVVSTDAEMVKIDGAELAISLEKAE